MRKIFKITANGRTFTMISMNDITVEEALDFARGKWPNANLL